MNLNNAAEWFAWAGIAIPLMALAWSAVFYTLTRREEQRYQEYQRFFNIMDHLGAEGAALHPKWLRLMN